MPQMSPLFWPLIFSLLIYFMAMTKSILSSLPSSTIKDASIPLQTHKKELKW